MADGRTGLMCCTLPGSEVGCPVCSWLLSNGERENMESVGNYSQGKKKTEFILAACLKWGDFERDKFVGKLFLVC